MATDLDALREKQIVCTCGGVEFEPVRAVTLKRTRQGPQVLKSLSVAFRCLRCMKIWRPKKVEKPNADSDKG